ncbi:unnamed protein product [Tuber melanosporum]|uniref:(Perigord truffle) hypothetical protein n=1 Tax=Tuber melanosporum (strain Mel28) TaxID=656061 RepID=D5G4T0_TUBMM|nr:uncharacterized protein GSTUM_00000177001 [Tuber melanosporum]CAZ79523.1 unnamed protein product [Tuber melanosporum]
MANPGTTAAINQSPGSPTLSSGWEIIEEQRTFYDEQDCLHLGRSLTSDRLGDREENEVVIFEYSLDPDFLDPEDESSGDEEDESPSGDYDVFYRVPKDRLVGSGQFDQIINPTRDPRPIISPPPGQRLGIIDFPQCYDTSDGGLLGAVAEKLGLPGGTNFGETHWARVRALPGHGAFRTGISLWVPSREASQPGGKLALFASLPYFGRSSDGAQLGPDDESVGLLDFKRLGVGLASGAMERDDIGEILVHQARYMIFDNYTMATFRSKEDSVRDRVPLHRFQERVGAFRAMIHMIANRMDLELWTLGKLQASLCKVEEGIDQMISDAKTYENNQGMKGIAEDSPPGLVLPPETTPEKRRELIEDLERIRQDNVWGRKQNRVRELLASLNRLSAALFAAISVTERQIAVLQDLHNVLLTGHRRKTGNPFFRITAPIPILSKNREQIWPNTLDTIDEVVRERKSFIEKIKELVENMNVRKEILFGFLKSDQAKAAPSERTAQKTAEAMKSTENAIEKTREALVQQAQTLTGFTVVTTAFLPLGFCASYLGMDNLKLFGDTKMSILDFWLITAPVTAAIILLTVIVVFWKRPGAPEFRERAVKKFKATIDKILCRSPTKKPHDAENQSRGDSQQI